VIPAPRLFLLLALWMAAALAAAVLPDAIVFWVGTGAAIALLAAADALAVSRLATPDCQRDVVGSLALGVWSGVRLRLHNPGRRPIALEVFDRFPPEVAASGMPGRARIEAHGWVEMRYEIRPLERGELCFAAGQARVESPLGLWRRTIVLGERQCIKVYPNFAAVANYALLATDNHLSMLGIRLRQRRGEGMEFNQLREFREGDPLRQVDWKATSRLGKLISREYQDERDQQIVFLVDCGRRMHAKDGELSHFDHALNAVLLLSYVALRQGDAVGLMGFGGDSRYLPPRKGAHQINQVLESVYDMQAGTNSPDYAAAAAKLLTQLKKRSLVILVSNLRDEDNEELLPALQILRRKHLVLLASLRERALGEALDKPVENFENALTHSASLVYLAERQKAHDAILASGAHCIDIEPEALPVALVNRYLDIKRSGRL
jgi:uncharacterized protein (DUF58 family)